MYLLQRSDSVSINYTSREALNVSFRTSGSQIQMQVPVGAFDVQGESQLNITVSAANLTSSLRGVPQFLGVNSHEFDAASRVNLDAYAAIHIAAHAAGDSSDIVELLSPVYLHVPLFNAETVVDRLSTWFYNETFGIWQRVSTKVHNYVRGQQKLILEISLFGWWAAALEWKDTSCMTVSVSHVLASAITPSPLIGSVISISGVDYSFSSIGATNTVGSACVEQKTYSSSILQIVDEQFGVDSGPVVVGSSSTGACAEKQTWLAEVSKETNCSRLHILCKIY